MRTKTVTLLVRTKSSQFIQIEMIGEEITTSMVYDVSDWLKDAPVGSGKSTLHPFLVKNAQQLCRSYGTELFEPVDYFVVKESSGEASWATVEMNF